jgi:hypothetical protein
MYTVIQLYKGKEFVIAYEILGLISSPTQRLIYNGDNYYCHGKESVLMDRTPMVEVKYVETITYNINRPRI